MPGYRAANWVGLATSYRMDQMYRSMYALNLEPWLNSFFAYQFFVVPMNVMRNGTTAAENLKQIAKKLNMVSFPLPKLKNHVDKERAKRMSGWRPLAEDLTNETRDGLRMYFDADTRKLSEILAPRIRQGLFLVGYKG